MYWHLPGEAGWVDRHYLMKGIGAGDPVRPVRSGKQEAVRASSVNKNKMKGHSGCARPSPEPPDWPG